MKPVDVPKITLKMIWKDMKAKKEVLPFFGGFIIGGPIGAGLLCKLNERLRL